MFSTVTNESYSLNNAWTKPSFVKYVYIIIRDGIRGNIIDNANQVFFDYQKFVMEVWVFLLLLTKLIKISSFNLYSKKKQK